MKGNYSKNRISRSKERLEKKLKLQLVNGGKAEILCFSFSLRLQQFALFACYFSRVSAYFSSFFFLRCSQLVSLIQSTIIVLFQKETHKYKKKHFLFFLNCLNLGINLDWWMSLTQCTMQTFFDLWQQPHLTCKNKKNNIQTS